MSDVELSPDQLLSTTRAVRRRLDFNRPVELATVLECIELAVQAPTGGGREGWRWVIVVDPEQRAAVAEVYRSVAIDRFAATAAAATGRRRRLYEDAVYLAENLHRAPVLVVPCVAGRIEDQATNRVASFLGSILPAVWSFQLALRSRSLGSCWTTVHLRREREMATVLGVPDDHSQVALLPVAHTLGTGFKPARRRPIEEIVHVDRWHGAAP